MTDMIETSRGKMVCEVVPVPEEVGRMINLFQLAGAMTGQVVEVRTTTDPGKAGAAVLVEAAESFAPNVLKTLNTFKHGLRGRDESMKLSGLGDLLGAILEGPFFKAGEALYSTIYGATAVFVNVDDPAAFRAELDVFKELDRPLEQ